LLCVVDTSADGPSDPGALLNFSDIDGWPHGFAQAEIVVGIHRRNNVVHDRNAGRRKTSRRNLSSGKTSDGTVVHERLSSSFRRGLSKVEPIESACGDDDECLTGRLPFKYIRFLVSEYTSEQA
jgi:hypothetical protein